MFCINLAFDVEKKDLIQGNAASSSGTDPGVYIQGKCPTVSCEAHKAGMTVCLLEDFDEEEGDLKVIDMREAEWVCRLCKKQFKKDKVLFYACTFDVHWRKRVETGVLHPPKREPLATTGMLRADANGKFYEFAAGELVQYTSFYIKWKRNEATKVVSRCASAAEENAKTGTWFAPGINPQGECLTCGKRVYCHKAFAEVDLPNTEFTRLFKCPLTGCDGYFEPDQIVFWRCDYYTVFQKQVHGKLVPPGQGNTSTSATKTCGEGDFHKFVECSEDDLCNYTTIKFFAKRNSSS